MLFRKTFPLRKFVLIWSLFLLIAGSAIHFFQLDQPRQVVFDEVHFGKFSSAYFTGENFFDIHPPLGKLIIAAGAKLGGYGDYLKENPPFPFEDIGEEFNSVPFLGFRFFPALAGTLLPLAVFLFLLSLGVRRSTAELASLFCLGETSLLTQSQYILLDSFLLLFGFLGLFFFFYAQKKPTGFWLFILAGIFLGASLSVKWTGLSFMGIALIFWTIEFLDLNEKALGSFFSKFIFPKSNPPSTSLEKFQKERWLNPLKSLLLVLVSAFAIYSASFAVHFQLLPLAGPGDDFMEENFRQGQLGFWGKFVQLNQKMLFYNSTLTASHPDASFFWQWPILKKPVHYWNEASARIIFFGNPVLWLGGFLGVVLFLVFWKKISLPPKTKFVLLLGYWSNLLPFVSVTRSLFLYHYLSALIFSFILWAVVLTEVFDQNKFKTKLLWAFFLFFALIGFLLSSCLAYGLAPWGEWHRKLLDAVLYY